MRYKRTHLGFMWPFLFLSSAQLNLVCCGHCIRVTGIVCPDVRYTWSIIVAIQPFPCLQLYVGINVIPHYSQVGLGAWRTVGDLTWIICLLTTHPLCQFLFHAPLWTHVIPCGKDCYHNSAVFIYATDEHITNFPVTSCMYNMQMTEVLSPIFVPYL